MQDDFSELQALLRLKRYETPPPDYYEDFLLEFHQRQRAELLRRPLWRIALDRMGNWVPTFPALPVPSLAYAGATALAVIAAGGMVSRQMSSNGASLAAHQPTLPAAAVLAANPTLPSTKSLFAPSLAVSLAEADDALTPAEERALALRLARGSAATAASNPASARPTRYLLETQPVRYEPRSTSF